MAEAIRQVTLQSETLGLHITNHEEFDAARDRAEQSVQQALTALEQIHQVALKEAAQQAETSRQELFQQFTDTTNEKVAYLLEEHRKALESHQEQLIQKHEAALKDALSVARNEREEHSVALIRANEEQYQRALSAANEGLYRSLQENSRKLLQDYQDSLEAATAANQRDREEQRAQFEQARNQAVAEIKSQLTEALATGANNYQEALKQAAADFSAEQQRNTENAVASISARWKKFSTIVIICVGATALLSAAALVIALL